MKNRMVVVVFLLALALGMGTGRADASPSFVSLDPADSSTPVGVAAEFTSTVGDSLGYANIQKLSLTFKTGTGTKIEVGSLGLEYERYSGHNWIKLWNPDTGKWLKGDAGSAAILENTWCLVDLSLCSVQGDGQLLTVVWNITPKAGFVGDKRIWITSIGVDGSRQSNLEIGSWAVTAGLSYGLTLLTDPEIGGTTDPAPGTHAYIEGEVATITATAAPGYRFDGWTGDVTDPAAASTTVVVDGDKDVTAHFVPVPSYTLTISEDPAGAGIVNPTAGGHTHFEGDVVNLSASALPGYLFNGWTGDVANPAAASTTVVVDGDKEVTAHFLPVPVHTLIIAVTPAGAGTVDPPAGTHSYSEGSVVSISAVAGSGYQFLYWTGDSVADANAASTTITLNADAAVTANFEPADANALPEFVSLTPADSTGAVNAPLALSLVASDVDGTQDIQKVMLTIKEGEGTKLVLPTDLGIEFERINGFDYIKLYDASVARWRMAKLGTQTVLQNPLCRIEMAHVSKQEVGNTLTVNFYIVPKATFTGSKRIWTRIRDSQDTDKYNGTHTFLPLEVGSWVVLP